MKQKMCLVILLTFSVAVTLLAAEKMMSLQVRDGYLRAEPSFLGKIVTSVKYADRFAVVEEKGQWSKVTVPGSGISGWIHVSALTKKKIVMKPGEKDVELAASSGELALAGKGFNSDVEAQFKTQNKDIDFTWVDKMEKMVVSREEMKEFLKEGSIVVQEGGAR